MRLFFLVVGKCIQGKRLHRGIGELEEDCRLAEEGLKNESEGRVLIDEIVPVEV